MLRITSDSAANGEVLSSCGCCDGITATLADASLMTAAPDLLAACDLVVDWAEGTCSMVNNPHAADLLEMLRAAIAKAKA